MGLGEKKGKATGYTSLRELLSPQSVGYTSLSEILPKSSDSDRANSMLPLPEFVKTIYPNLREDQKRKLVDGKLVAISVKDDDSGISYSMQLEWDNQGYKLLGVDSLFKDRGISTRNEARVSCIDGKLHFSLVK